MLGAGAAIASDGCSAALKTMRSGHCASPHCATQCKVHADFVEGAAGFVQAAVQNAVAPPADSKNSLEWCP